MYIELISGFTELFSDQYFTIPAMQVVFFMLVNSLCLLFGRFKLGLLVSYCFAFYWGLVFNGSLFVDLWGNTTDGFTVYLVSGLAMLVIAVVGFFKND